MNGLNQYHTQGMAMEEVRGGEGRIEVGASLTAGLKYITEENKRNIKFHAIEWSPKLLRTETVQRLVHHSSTFWLTHINFLTKCQSWSKIPRMLLP